MSEKQSDFSHNIYKNDPLLLKSYVDKTISIKTKDGGEHTGVVYTVDPVSESIILINPVDDRLKLKIIMGSSIESTSLCSGPKMSVPNLFLSSEKDLPESVVLRRKNAVKELLLENRFPVEENDNVLNIQGIVSIEPPYDEEHCISANEIVLLRIQQIISNIDV